MGTIIAYNKGLQWTAMLPSMKSNTQIPGKSFVNTKTLHTATETRRIRETSFQTMEIVIKETRNIPKDQTLELYSLNGWS